MKIHNLIHYVDTLKSFADDYDIDMDIDIEEALSKSNIADINAMMDFEALLGIVSNLAIILSTSVHKKMAPHVKERFAIFRLTEKDETPSDSL